MIKKEQSTNYPSPEDIGKLQASIGVLIDRGEVRAETRDLLKILENGNSWGLPKDDVDASIRALRSFMNRPYLFREDVEDMVTVFEEERKFARIDWAKKREDLSNQLRRARRTTARLAAAALCIGGLYLLGNRAYNEYQEYEAPTAVAQRQLENQQKQEANRIKQDQKKQEQINVENTHTLGLTPSVVSLSGFRIRYNPIDKNVKYVEVGGELGFFSVAKGDPLNWKQKDDKSTTTLKTNIYVGRHARVLDGKQIPSLASRVGYKNQNPIEERWYLRDQSTDEIDASVVVVEDTKNQREYYFTINSFDNGNTFQIRQMKPEPTSNQTDQ